MSITIMITMGYLARLVASLLAFRRLAAANRHLSLKQIIAHCGINNCQAYSLLFAITNGVEFL